MSWFILMPAAQQDLAEDPRSRNGLQYSSPALKRRDNVDSVGRLTTAMPPIGVESTFYYNRFSW